MENRRLQQLVTWWVLWAAFLGGICIMYKVLGSTVTSASSLASNSNVWIVAAAPVFVSAVIRWVVLPRASSIRAALILFVLGIAMAEATLFFGLFLFPAHKLELFIASALGVIQFIPYYAGRFAGDGV